MNKKLYFNTISIIFVIIAVAHLLRGINEWEAVIAGVVIPVWISWVAVVIAVYLAWRGCSLARKCQ